MEFGDSLVLTADVFPEMGGKTPRDLGGTPVTVMLYVEDVDAVFEAAIAAGGIAGGQRRTGSARWPDPPSGIDSGRESGPMSHEAQAGHAVGTVSGTLSDAPRSLRARLEVPS